MNILNIAAGKQKPLFLNKLKSIYTLVNLDQSYFTSDTVKLIENHQDLINNGITTMKSKREFFCNEDIFEFMERTRMSFDLISIYRFLEHIPFDRALYFIYLLSTITKKGGVIDVIVPDYNILAQMILDEDVSNPNFEAENILLTTELLNEPGCPHASIWTLARAYKYFELEGRFEIQNFSKSFKFDGRDIYLRFQVKRI